MKKILISISAIAIVAAIAVGATVAYFSDTETSTGNTFTAGAIDLKVDSTATYNGEPVAAATWQLKDLVPTADKFFNFDDIKPGDSGENTISLHVFDNDAWVCAEVSGLVSAENGCNEPETQAEPNCAQDNNGELQNAMVWTVWRDDGGDEPCDNIQQDGEDVLAEGSPVNGVLAVYDSNTGTGALEGGTTTCLGVSWTLPAETGNEVQTDSLTGDISFRVEQARNNADFRCVPQPAVCEYNVATTGTPYQGLYGSTVTPVTITNTDCSQVTALKAEKSQNYAGTGWAGWSCVEPGYPNAVGGGVVGGLAAAQGLAEFGAPAVGGFNYPVYPHYTFNGGSNTSGGEEGWVAQATTPVPTGIYVLCAN